MNAYDEMCADPEFRWNGKHGKGAMRIRREEKREEALARQRAYNNRRKSANNKA